MAAIMVPCIMAMASLDTAAVPMLLLELLVLQILLNLKLIGL